MHNNEVIPKLLCIKSKISTDCGDERGRDGIRTPLLVPDWFSFPIRTQISPVKVNQRVLDPF